MLTEPFRADWTGRTVDGRYTLLGSLGSSAHRSVYLTELRGHGSQKAAIKLIPADTEDAPALLDRWKAIAALSHPHLMHLLHSGRCEIDSLPCLYVVTELAEETLASVLLERPLTPAEVREMLGPILSALACLHQNGFVHAHLKPSHILVVDDQLRLSTDSLLPAGARLPHGAELSIDQAPELAAGPAFPPADIWSLGVTLIEALTQQPPIWEIPLDRDPVVSDSIPQPFFDIARACLRSDPQLRCSVPDLTALLQPPPVRGAPLASSTHTHRKPVSRRLIAASAAGLLLLSAAVAVWLHPFPHRQSSSPAQPPPVAAPQPHSQLSSQPRPSALPGSSLSAEPGAAGRRVLPQVPLKASQTIQGSVELGVQVTVDPSGSVTGVVLDPPGPSKYFAALALQAAKGWSFKPPRLAGRPVPSVWLLHFHFRQDAVDVTPVQISPAIPAS